MSVTFEEESAKGGWKRARRQKGASKNQFIILMMCMNIQHIGCDCITGEGYSCDVIH